MSVATAPPTYRPDRTITDDLNRRRFLGGVAGTATLLGLAGCGSSGQAAGPGAGAPGTRTIATARGAVEVPSDPQRVACIDPGFSWQTLLEIGLTPVGLPTVVDSLVLPDNLAKARTIPTLVTSSGGGVDLEKVAAARPDLILANSGPSLDAIAAQLTAIAPVAAFPFNFPSDWVELDRSFADAVNRADRLDAVVARYDQRVAQLKDRHGDVIGAQRWALVTESNDQVFVWGSRSSAGPVLAAAGAAFSAGAPGQDAPFTPLSLEKLDTLTDATVILYGATAAGAPYANTARLLSQPVFTQLPAARAGHVYPLPSWFAYCHQDALAQLDGLDRACRTLRR